MPLAITHCSLLTPLDSAGCGTWEALRVGKRVEGRPAVEDFLLDGEEGLDRSLRLALAVARRAMIGRSAEGMQLFCGTSKGTATTMLAGLERLRQGRTLTMEQARQIVLGVGAMGAVLGERLGMAGGHTSVAACSSGLHALHRAARAVERGECERALVVAADASLHELFEGSFARLGVLAPRDESGVRRCEPFGEEGRGFFLVEAGAAVVLENVAAGEKGVKEPMAWVERTWIGGDSTGIVGIDPTGEGLRRGLAACGGGSLAFVHAHATGTEHDRYELQAIREVLGGEVPVFSHKKWIGHSLGAAGLVSVVLSALAHQEGALPGGERVALGSSVTIAQGFGGHIGVVRLRGG